MASSIIPKSLASDVNTLNSKVSAIHEQFMQLLPGTNTITAGNPAFILMSNTNGEGVLAYCSGGSVTILAGKLNANVTITMSGVTITVVNGLTWALSAWVFSPII